MNFSSQASISKQLHFTLKPSSKTLQTPLFIGTLLIQFSSLIKFSWILYQSESFFLSVTAFHLLVLLLNKLIFLLSLQHFGQLYRWGSNCAPNLSAYFILLDLGFQINFVSFVTVCWKLSRSWVTVFALVVLKSYDFLELKLRILSLVGFATLLYCKY